jgi:hypothetical protein
VNNYTIIIHNEKEDIWEKRVVKKLTFPEAAMSAYNTRCRLGYAWKIISICKKDEKEKENV